MNRITEKDLQAVCDHLNRLTGSPKEPYTVSNGRNVSNPDCYLLDHAYGGVALHRIANLSGGVYDIFHGHYTKRELYDRMHAYIQGIESTMFPDESKAA